jgi:hypothetical protein
LEQGEPPDAAVFDPGPLRGASSESEVYGFDFEAEVAAIPGKQDSQADPPEGM